MSGRGSPIDQVHQQRTLQTEERKLVAIMQTTLNTMGPLRDVRPNQDEDASMFPTPGNSPPYTNDGGACFAAQTDISCQYPQAGINGLNMPAVPVSNANQYIPAPGSPVDEAYYHGQSSPYSPPYDDASSSHSMACSPHSNVSCSPIACTGANFETYMPAPPPPVDSLTSMASTGVSLPPITTIPLTTTTPLHFPTDLDNNQKNIYTTAPPQPNFYPPISQTGVWPQPQHLARFNEAGFVPPHSAAMICTSVADGGEVPINVIDQHTGFPETDIAYYPLTPESPENRQAAYACHADFVAMQKAPGLYLPPGHGAPVLSFPNHVKPTANKATKRKRPQKPAVQVDDTEIKDIPTSAQLWEFTLRVLKKPKYHYMVNWENKKEGLFRFHDAQAFAALWGKHRNRPNMTYDKVARALRYYYKRDILNQVGGRLTYRFSKRLSKLYMTDE